jgi:adenylate cyclase
VNPRRKLEFGGFVLNPVERTLRPPGGGAPVELQPKLLETLLALMESNGGLVTKSELLDRVWPDAEVQEGSLTRNIYLLRQILGVNAIETVAKAGYKFSMGPVSETAPVSDPSGIRSVAVLPFALFGPSALEHLADGITEEIIDALNRVPGHRVIARTTSFQFKNRTGLDLRQVGSTLRVDTILEGSVRCSSAKLRVTAQLIDCRTGFHLWSESYDSELHDILDLQREIADTVVRRMSRSAAQSARKEVFRPSLAAYDHYAQGRFLGSLDSNEHLPEAVRCFEQALALEPGYAAAHAALADCYIKFVTYGDMLPHEGMPQVRRHTGLALQSDPANAIALMLAASTSCIYDWDYRKAEAEFEAVIRANPWYGFARYLYAFFLLTPLGRFGEAAAQLEQALQLDPLSTHIQAARVSLLLFEGRLEEAMEIGARVAAHDPKSCLIAVQYSWALMTAGRFAEAEREIDRAKSVSGKAPQLVTAAEGLLAGMMGDWTKAFHILRDDAFNTARLRIWLGQRDEALRCLREAIEVRSIGVLFLDRIPDFQAFRGDPVFEAIRREAGLA